MWIWNFQEIGVAEFFYSWIVGTSESVFSSILDLERTLFYDLKNFVYSEIDNLPISELYFLILTGPHEKKDDDNKTDDISSLSEKDKKRAISKFSKSLGLQKWY